MPAQPSDPPAQNIFVGGLYPGDSILSSVKCDLPKLSLDVLTRDWHPGLQGPGAGWPSFLGTSLAHVKMLLDTPGVGGGVLLRGGKSPRDSPGSVLDQCKTSSGC